jgi:hypothetical protein
MKPTRTWMGIIGLVLATGCDQPIQPKTSPEASQLRAATDVFWALQKQGFVVAKQKPQASQHGCRPFEYLAQAGQAQDGGTASGHVAPAGARFRISVFECSTIDKAREITEHAHTRHVDSLLRNRHEGGVLRRQALQIIIRMEQGEAGDADRLLSTLGEL